MSITTVPSALAGVEFARIHFLLEFQERFTLEERFLLSLRRNLRRVARHILGEDDGRFSALFDPPLPTDPLLLRRHQLSSPGFIVHPSPAQIGTYDCGDTLRLELVLLGSAVQSLEVLAAVFAEMGRSGLGQGQGFYELVAIETEDASGNLVCIWKEGERAGTLAPALIDVPWWVEGQVKLQGDVVLEFLTPARLISAGKPLFHPNFDQIFPFILRRVTSMISAHCSREIVDDPQTLIKLAESIEERDRSLEWRDWKTLETSDHVLEVGGVVGSLGLVGDSLGELLWILHLGSLLNVGKNASYGSGSYRLR